MAASGTTPPQANPDRKGGTKTGPSFSAGFAPSIGLSVNVGNKTGAPGAANNPGTGVNRTSALALPEPAFYGSADVRSYCEALRAFCAYSAIEVEVGAEILKAALQQVQGAPNDHAFQNRMRARGVARKLSKAADALTDAAKLAAAAWSAYQREYVDATGTPRPVAAQARPFQI